FRRTRFEGTKFGRNGRSLGHGGQDGGGLTAGIPDEMKGAECSRPCTWRSRQCQLCLTEYPSEDRVDVPGVVAEVELFPDPSFAERGADFLVREQFVKKILALLPDLHGVPL